MVKEKRRNPVVADLEDIGREVMRKRIKEVVGLGGWVCPLRVIETQIRVVGRGAWVCLYGQIDDGMIAQLSQGLRGLQRQMVMLSQRPNVTDHHHHHQQQLMLQRNLYLQRRPKLVGQIPHLMIVQKLKILKRKSQ